MSDFLLKTPAMLAFLSQRIFRTIFPIFPKPINAASTILKTLYVIKSDEIWLSCKSKVCKFPKNSMGENYMRPEIKDQAPKVLWDFHISLINASNRVGVSLHIRRSCNNFRELSVLDPESKDMYHCHPHHFLEIFKIQVNEPIGSYQIQHLNLQCTIIQAIRYKQFLVLSIGYGFCQSALPFNWVLDWN